MAFGERLRRARKEMGISLNELSARTKIRVSVLEAIERGDVAHLPAGFYTKAFLRAYAAEVHLDAEPIVQEYVALFEAPPPAAEQAEVSEDPNSAPQMAELLRRIRPRLAPMAMFALAALLFLFVFNLTRTNPTPAASPQEPGAVATAGNATSPAVPPTPAADNSPVSTPAEPKRLTVEVRPKGLLWLEASADGKRVVRKLLQPHEDVVVDASAEIRLLIGDAGAFDYSINGQPGRPLGGPGEVRTIAVNRNSYRELLAAPPDGSR